VAEPSKVVQRLAAVDDTNHAEHSAAAVAQAVDVWKVCDLRSLCALVLYLALSILFFGRSLLGHLSTFHIGVGPDPGLTMWFLVWWPHAIAHGLNLFITHVIWAPSGFNLAWQTSIPLASLLASPFTLTVGPIAAYNNTLSAEFAAQRLVCVRFMPLSEPKLLDFASRRIHIWLLRVRARASLVWRYVLATCISSSTGSVLRGTPTRTRND
jgi:hypothetical protein